jgi:DNA repair photolyase
MKVNEVTCRSALSKSRLPGLKYALNPYRGCSHGCGYCYASAVLRETRPWGEFVDVKRNIPTILSKELRTREKGNVQIGTVTDGYQPLERRFEITRMCLEQFLRHDFPVTIQTKSSLVLRDLDLLTEFEEVDVGFTLTTLDEKWRRAFEPGASPSEDRLLAMKDLSSRGIRTWAFVGPILPLVTEKDTEELISRISDAGASEILVDKLNIKRDTWAKLAPILEEHGLEANWRTLVRDKAYSDNVVDRLFDSSEAKGINCLSAF